jgi:uncharacterized lipoprotein YbaY/membrane-bound inhibitor of C-type lysozyme
MKKKWMRLGILALVAAGMACGAKAQDNTTPANPAPEQPHNNVKKAIRWKQFDYTCAGDAKLTVYLGDTLAKVKFGEKTYLMHQTMSADGNRYSDGKIVWWGKGNGGFLQEDAADGNGKMIGQDCKLVEPKAKSQVSGTVSYMQRVALPPNAVIQVQLLDVSLADAPSKVIGEQWITLGQRQVPVPFTINYDPAKIDERHSYSLSAKITVDGTLRFISDQSYPVITRGNPARADLLLRAPSTKS